MRQLKLDFPAFGMDDIIPSCIGPEHNHEIMLLTLSAAHKCREACTTETAPCILEGKKDRENSLTESTLCQKLPDDDGV